MFQMIDELITTGAVHDALRKQQRAATKMKLEAESAKDDAAVEKVTLEMNKLEKLEENMKAAQAMGKEKVVQKAKEAVDTAEQRIIEELGLQRKELLLGGTKEVMRKRLHCDLL